MSGEPQEIIENRTAEKPDILYVRSQRARHYRLTLRRDGVGVATIPVRGSEREAQRFVELHRIWLERARARQARRPRAVDVWTLGTAVLWRGELTEIRPVNAPLPAAAGPVFVPGTPCSAGFPGKGAGVWAGSSGARVANAATRSSWDFFIR